MTNKNPQIIDDATSFQQAVDGAQVSLRTVDLVRVQMQINLCKQMAEAANAWADECEKQPALIDSSKKRADIAQTLVSQFWNSTDHPSFKAFAEELSSVGFDISRVLFQNYHEGLGAPQKSRIIPFMRAVAKVGDNAAARLQQVSEDIGNYRLSPSILNWAAKNAL